MIALWMVYSILVSVALAAAALAVEKGLELYGRPTRWVWAAALAGAVLLPLAAFLLPGSWPAGAAHLAGSFTGNTTPGAAAPGGGGLFTGSVAAVAAGGGTASALASWSVALRWLDPWLLGAWAAASLGLLAILAVSQARHAHRRAGWQDREVHGLRVRLSGDRGPAVSGLLHGTVLLPAWFETMGEEDQRLILRHEREHLESQDHRLFGAALGVVVTIPWNPVLWWAVRRLRHAVEVDCDRRVLGSGCDRAAYGRLLMRAAKMSVRSGFTAAALAASPSFLERRIRQISSSRPRHRGLRAGLAVAAAGALLAAGGKVPTPPQRSGGPAAESIRPPAAAQPTWVQLRLYAPRAPVNGEAAAGRSAVPSSEDRAAVDLAKVMSYRCGVLGERITPDGAADAEHPKCLLILDGERVDPRTLLELPPGSIAGIDMIPPREAVARYGDAGQQGAYLVTTRR